ncbi:MAG: DUF4397 domain-containing protein [Actinomycetota bacterium]|nr:DUF4397 domain-containing protein [Actinomycetota bacterium]
MRTHTTLRRSLAPIALALAAVVIIPAQALGKAVVRFIHAVPGVGTASVNLDTGTGMHPVGSVGFGQVSGWLSIRAGSFRWALTSGGKLRGHGTATLGDGAYDIVVLDRKSGISLGVYRVHAGRPGSSLARVIHAAPELGSPELTFDSKIADKSLSFTSSTPYLSVKPGTHVLGAMKPGTSTALVPGARVTLKSGVAYSAIVVGSRGQMVRVVTVVDRGAPLTRSAPRQAATAAASSHASASGGSVMVKPGDSLWSIARSLVPAGASDAEIEHRLVEIWARNARRIGTNDPNLIFSGQLLLT